MTPTLTLYKLDSELTELLDYRQERVEDTQSPASAEELAACDTAIRAYMEALPAKVDRVASVLRYFDEQAEWADKEIRRLKARKSAIEENAQRLKDCAAAVLEKQPIPAKGCRKLAGSTSTLMLKGNGGVQPLVISQPELVPDKLCAWQGVFTGHQFMNVMRILGREWPRAGLEEIGRAFTRIPSTTLIREALIQPCAACDGEGRTDNEMADGGSDLVSCRACGGTGRASVPGAHLGERSFHVEVR